MRYSFSASSFNCEISSAKKKEFFFSSYQFFSPLPTVKAVKVFKHHDLRVLGVLCYSLDRVDDGLAQSLVGLRECENGKRKTKISVENPFQANTLSMSGRRSAGIGASVSI